MNSAISLFFFPVIFTNTFPKIGKVFSSLWADKVLNSEMEPFRIFISRYVYKYGSKDSLFKTVKIENANDFFNYILTKNGIHTSTLLF
ncbi:hypothetical protein AYI70_g490 [Smittium culicis]|uniref:Uncharacterized protein n=1 Tax=Smittium culicis TaxID=133412 RepID=A0A1R1YGI3_9FUNG|nr:hypothetical protein AYI70_g490 [Smittium culicis]